MVVTTYFHKLVARLLLPCDKVVAWLFQPWHFYMGNDVIMQIHTLSRSLNPRKGVGHTY